MRDLIVAFFLTFVLEGLYYAIAPEKVQAIMRELVKLDPDMLRKTGLLIAAIGVAAVVFIRRMG